MIDLHDVIIKPLITEKSMGSTATGRYIFEIHPKANKYEIKQALKEVLNVDVLKVNVLYTPGKFRRYGKTTGRTQQVKKAVVTIKAGQKIELFES